MKYFIKFLMFINVTAAIIFILHYLTPEGSASDILFVLLSLGAYVLNSITLNTLEQASSK